MKLAALAFSAVLASLSPAGSANAGEGRFSFLDSSGVCQGSPGILKTFGKSLSWDRQDFSWSKYVPKQGQFDEAYMDKFLKSVEAYRAAGKEVLPIFCYGNGWAADRNASYEAGRKRFDYYEDASDGKVHCKVFEKQRDGSWKEAKDSALNNLSRAPIALDKVGDWEDFVRHSVRKMMAPPYNLKYFQVWNEAHPESSFWNGDMDSYMERIHLPAARAIKEEGGKTVYGGWPCCGSLSSFVALLDKHKAWESVDALDVHYFPLSSFAYLRREGLKRGRDLGVWQTEVAFTSNKLFIASAYPRFLHWCLENGAEKDKYKLFFFAAKSPDDPKAYGYGRSLLSGENFSAHGLSLQALGEIFGDEKLAVCKDVESVPSLKPELDERLSSMEAFYVGDSKIAVALHVIPNNSAKIFVDWNANDDTMHLGEGKPAIRLKFPLLDASRIERAERVNFVGERLDITESLSPGEGGKGVSLLVPVRDAKKSETPYTEMPEDVVKDSFYAVIKLKKEGN